MTTLHNIVIERSAWILNRFSAYAAAVKMSGDEVFIHLHGIYLEHGDTGLQEELDKHVPAQFHSSKAPN